MTTSALVTPENTSILQANKFTFVIPQLPFARYFCQDVVLPGVSTTAIEVPTPFTSTYRHGEKLIYEQFSINAIVDEDLRVWEETYKWLVSITKPTGYDDYKKYNGGERELYFDGILTINTNANLPNMRFKFKSCHPVALGSISFSTKENAETIPTIDITFRYDSYELERI